MTATDILIRLFAAFAVGGALGLNRDLHHKPAGVRTIGLVCLAAATLVLAASEAAPGVAGFADVSRIIQGLMTGVGFLGAGVIMHRPDGARVTGLTTAAAIWFAAAIAVLCGLGEFALVGVLVTFAVALLSGGLAVERLIERVFGKAGDAHDTDDLGGG